MIILLYLSLFLISGFLVYISSRWLVKNLVEISKFLQWREFVVAFFIMAFSGALPDFFIGLSSAAHKVPQLAFGDVVGGNVVDLTLVVALATLVYGGLPAKSKTVQTTSLFTIVAALLPLFLVLDGSLGRGDGLILISFFVVYILWLFSKQGRFKKTYDEIKPEPLTKEAKLFFKGIGKVIFGIIILLAASEGIVRSSLFFAKLLNFPIGLIGILIIGLGNCAPEAYFSLAAAKERNHWLILGDLMGSVIVISSLVLGLIVLIYPIKIIDFSPFLIARIFLLLAAFFFLFFIRTDKKLTKKEAIVLLLIYLSFVIIELTHRPL